MDADLDTLATALYARTDDLLKAVPERAPWRPAAGICPQISDAELVTPVECGRSRQTVLRSDLAGYAEMARSRSLAHGHR